MLHHVPSVALQDALFAEIHRLLPPAGCSSARTDWPVTVARAPRGRRLDLPVDPDTLPVRLGDAGFTEVDVDTNEYAVRFRARKAATA